MKTNKIRLVIGAAVIALSGILFLQGFWIMKSWKMHVRNYRHRVHQAAVHSAHRLEKGHFKRMMRLHKVYKHHDFNGKKEKEVHVNIIRSNSAITHDGQNKKGKIIIVNGDTVAKIDVANSGVTTVSNNKVAAWNTQLAELSLEKFITDSTILMEIENLPIDSIVSSEMNKENIGYNYTYEIITSEEPEFLDELRSKNKNGKVIVPLFRETLKDQPVFLKIDMSKRQASIPPWFILMIISSLFFSGIMIWAFWYVLIGLLKQKRISDIKSDFINNMTHEFKTPISTISLAVDSIRHDKVKMDSSKIDYYSSIIKAENKRMNKQVERVLQAAQLEKGELIFEKNTVDLVSIIEEVIGSFQLILEEKLGKIIWNNKQGKIMIFADENHLFNVFNNLIDNAIKYGKHSPEIKVGLSVQNNTCVIVIKDNGIGMSPEILKRLFSRFYRAESGDLHSVKGFGLGLNYVKYVVEKHDGKISVTSKVNKGSTFKLEFPVL